MKQVIVSWETTSQVLQPGALVPHHIHVGLALQEVRVPIEQGSHTFEVEPGQLEGHAVICAEDQTEIPPLKTFSVNVPVDTMVPVLVSVSAAVA